MELEPAACSSLVVPASGARQRRQVDTRGRCRVTPPLGVVDVHGVEVAALDPADVAPVDADVTCGGRFVGRSDRAGRLTLT